MIREHKKVMMDAMCKIIDGFDYFVLVRMNGLTCKELTNLRVCLRKGGAGLKVTKNNLAKVALCDSVAPEVLNLFSGFMSIFYSDDVLALSKYIVGLADSDDRVEVVGAVYCGAVIEVAQIRKMASVHSLDSLRLTMMDTIFGSVMRGLYFGLQGQLSLLIRVLKHIGKC